MGEPQHSGKPLNKQDFEALFNTYFPALCAFANKYLHNFEDAREIVHTTFIKLWEKRAEIDLEKSVKTYLFTSVRNRCLNFIRDQKKFLHNEGEIESLNISDNDDDDDHEAQAELEAKIHAVVNSLPAKCREIFVLNRFKGLKYREVAEKLDISVKTVETQMSKALKIIKEELKDYVNLLILVLFQLYLALLFAELLLPLSG